jgi:pilus assembly protein FimV
MLFYFINEIDREIVHETGHEFKGLGLSMNRPPRTKLVAALGGVLLATSAFMADVANAAGLGRLTVNSALGQPLSAEVELTSLQPGEFENLVARVASPEAYTDAKIEYSPLLRQLRFSPEKRSDGKPVLRITSSAPINEPFLDLLVEMNWPSGRLLREYPILLDPVGFNEARVAPPVASATPSRVVSTPVPSSAPIVGSSSSSSITYSGDTYGPVKSGDTLNQIAKSIKPDSVSLEQMLVALYRENKSAFIGNNMNQLKTGQILRVPSADDATKIARNQAVREINAQVADWKSYRGQVASAVAAGGAKPAAANEAAGKISVATPSAPAASATPSDQLKIAKTDGGTAKAGSAGAKGTPEQINALREEAIAKDNQIKEANSRVAALEKQVADMRKLMEMKGVTPPAVDAKVAKVDDKAKVAEKAPEPAKPAAPVDAKVAQTTPPAKPADAKPAETKVAESAKTEPPKVEPPKTEAPKVDVAKTDVKPVVPPKPAAPKAPPPPEPSFLEENAVALGAGTAGLLGVGGLLMFLSRRKKKPAKTGGNSQLVNTSSIMPSDLKPNTVTGNRAGGLVDTGNSSFLTDFDKTGPGMIDTDEVDPVAEAEVYIAYGRDTQAEEILKEAMARDKSRHAITVKLLEIYHTRKSKDAFEPMARELKDAIGTDNPMWAKVAAMGASIDPTNSLYGGVGQAFDATGTFPAGVPAAVVGAGALAAAGAASAVAAAQPAAAPDLDFDLGFGDSSTTAPIDITAAQAGQQAASKTDFDLDLGPASTSNAAAAPKDGGLDFDLAFDIPADSKPAVAAAAPAAKPADPSFDFDLSALSLDTPAKPAAAAFTPEKTQPSADFGGFSLDLGSGTTAAPAVSAGTGAAATKLELAKAYIEIGDAEGAKDILNEVTREGDAAQQAEAKKILAGI